MTQKPTRSEEKTKMKSKLSRETKIESEEGGKGSFYM